jgi:hypothetical protein
MFATLAKVYAEIFGLVTFLPDAQRARGDHHDTHHPVHEHGAPGRRPRVARAPAAPDKAGRSVTIPLT